VSRKSGKSKVIKEAIRELGADAICLTETNVNWDKVDIHNRLHEWFMGWWQKVSINIAHYATLPPKKMSATTPLRFGGIALLSINDGAARVTAKGQDATGLGRWAWTQYQGKDGHSLRVVAAYRCNRANDNVGSVYNQQKAYFEMHDDDRDPREAFWEDLSREIQPWLEGTALQGLEDAWNSQAYQAVREHVIIALDMNEDVRAHASVSTFRHLGLTEIITHRHGRDTPGTCSRGSTPIDGIFVSAGLLDSDCGYLPVAHDHRHLWIDINVEQVFGAEADISPRFKPQRLQNSDQRSCDKYLKDFAQLLCDELDFAQQLDSLYRGISPGTPFTDKQTEEFEELIRIHDTAAKKAEKLCRKLQTGCQQWTPQYTKNRNTRLFWLRLLSHRKGKHVNSRYLQRLAKKAGIIQPIRTLTEAHALQGLKIANAICAAYAKLHTQERDSFLIAWGKAEEDAQRIPARSSRCLGSGYTCHRQCHCPRQVSLVFDCLQMGSWLLAVYANYREPF
jgi:hypothetical protein